MCGICGFTGNLPDSKEVLTRMMDRIKHRGPDSAGQFITDKAAWGFRRLSIIDLDHGSQPMFMKIIVSSLSLMVRFIIIKLSDRI